MRGLRIGGALVCALSSGCFSAPPNIIACVETSDCRAGRVCISSRCLQPCTTNVDCGTGRVCSPGGGCEQATAATVAFSVTAIAGNGSDPAHIADGLRVTGVGLDGLATVELLASDNTALAALDIRAKNATEAELVLPQAIDPLVTSSTTATELTLRFAHASQGSLTQAVAFRRGDLGPPGPTGPAGGPYTSSELVSVDNGVVSLVPGPCSEGQVLMNVQGTLRCGGLTSVVASTPVSASTSSGTVTIDFDPSGGAHGSHGHYGDVWWSTGGPTPALTLLNSNLSSSDPVSGLTAINSYGANGAHSNAGVLGSGASTSSTIGVIGISESASGGVGVLGAATGLNGRGVSGWTQASAADAASIAGRADTADAVGVEATNTTASGVALKTVGRSQLNDAGIQLPLKWAVGPSGATSLATCPGPEARIVIGGGCFGNGAILANLPIATGGGGNCATGAQGTAQTVGATTGFDAFCCRVATGTVRAEAVCLRVD